MAETSSARAGMRFGNRSSIDPDGTALARAVSRLAAAADRMDDRRLSQRPLVAGVTPRAGAAAEAWATAKLATTTVLSPVVSLIVGRAAANNTAEVKRVIASYPSEVERVINGLPTSIPNGRVGRVDGSAQYFITSDLHRCVRGAADWPAAQNTKGLYETALEFYGARGWGLIENGDVEDFWLVGGSTYGVVYDALRLLTPLLAGEKKARTRAHLYGEHLRRIFDNNRGIYERIDDLFHRFGRYHRLVGNHDDCYLDERVVDHLRALHDGIEMYDFLVLDGNDHPAAVVTHGHHTDGWNAPAHAAIGRFGTWLASAVVDAPFLPANPGTPDRVETDQLLAGRHPDVLIVVNPTFGINRRFDTIDEVSLFRAFERHFGDDGPLVLLGHTHVPLARPSTPRRGQGTWAKYLNSGSGVHWHMVTGLEWDGSTDPDHPRVRLVAWHYADASTPHEAVVAEHDGRPVARQWFEPSDDGRRLQVDP